MSKKATNILITALLVILLVGYFIYGSLPAILSLAANTMMIFAILVGVPLCIYGLYRVVKWVNK